MFFFLFSDFKLLFNKLFKLFIKDKIILFGIFIKENK